MKTENRFRYCPVPVFRLILVCNAVSIIVPGCTPRYADPLLPGMNEVQTGTAATPENLPAAVKEQTVEALISALKDNVGYIRYYAANVLGLIGDKRAVEPLVTALSDPDADVRRHAARSLGLIGDRRAIIPLTGALKDVDYDVRTEAAHALDTLGWQPQNRIQEETYRIARMEERARSGIRDNSIQKYVGELRDEDARVRVSAAEALDEIGWRPGNESEKICYLLARGEWSGGVQTDLTPSEKEAGDSDLSSGELPAKGQAGSEQADLRRDGLDIGYIDLRIKPGIVVDLIIDGKKHIETRGGIVAVPSGEHRLDVLDRSCNVYAAPVTVRIKKNKTKKAEFKLRSLFPPLSKVQIDDLLGDHFKGKKIRNIKVIRSWRLSKTKYLVSLSFDYEGSAYYEFVPGNPYYAVPTRTVYPAGESGMVIFFSLEGFDLDHRDWVIKGVYYPPREPSP